MKIFLALLAVASGCTDRLRGFDTTVSARYTFSVLDQSSPLIRRVSTAVIAPGALPPKPGAYTPTSYFLREPRRWQLTTKFDF